MTVAEEAAIQRVLEALDESSSLGKEEQARQIVDLLALGIPPSSFKQGPGERRIYPHSLDVNGFAVTTAPKDLTIFGPFGPIIALSVDTTNTTSDAILQGEDTQAGSALRVRAGRVRRIEFDTPTDSQGVRVNQMKWRLSASATEANKVFLIEVE